MVVLAPDNSTGDAAGRAAPSGRQASAPTWSGTFTLTATGVSGNPLDSSSITHSQTVMLTVAPAPVTP